MSSEEKWRFPLGGFGEIKGINDAGVETFNSNSLRSLVRESLQNSLDAAIGETVRVEFEETTMPFSEVPDHDGLWTEFLNLKTRSGDKSKAAKRFIKKAYDATSGDIRVMRVSDYGTSGLRGSDSANTGSDWSRLIKESGSSGKTGVAGGSFGIGKYSSFACSDLRTVFFSSLDDSNKESHIGVARLLSSKMKDGQYTTGIGYFSNTERNVAIQSQLGLAGHPTRKKGDFGTDLYILGFRCDGDIRTQIIKYVLMDFLVSVWKGKLTVAVGDALIDKHSLGSYVSRLNAVGGDNTDKEITEHFDLLAARDPSKRIIEFDPSQLSYASKVKRFGWEKGDCTLYLKQGSDDLNREVTITRAAGMRIFNQKRFSSSIQFTGILMIEGKKMNQDFKDMEVPTHDKWAAERAENSKIAKDMIATLQKWVRDTVVETYKVDIEDRMEAFGTAIYLPKRESDDKGEAKHEDKHEDEHVQETLTPRIVEVHQRDVTPKKNDDRVISIRTNVTPDPDGDAVHKGKGKARGKTPRKATEGGDEEGYTRVPIPQRLICIDKSAGQYRLSFTIPHDAPKAKICLSIQGEQGEDSVGIRAAQAVAGTRRNTTFEGNAIYVDEVSSGTRAEISFTTDFPHYCMMGADYYEAN